MPTIYRFCFTALLATLGAMPMQAQQPSAETSRLQIEQLLAQQAAAWNQGDGPAWASAFSDDAGFINIRGDVFHGRDAIAQQHARIFAGPFKGSHATITLRRVTSPAPGVELIDTDYEVSGFTFLPPGIAPTEPGTLRTHMSYVAVVKEGRRTFIAAQNTAVLPALPGPK